MGIDANTKNDQLFSYGQLKAYYSTTLITTPGSPPSDYRNFGAIDPDSPISLAPTTETEEWRGGTPSLLLDEMITSHDLTTSFSLYEWDDDIIALLLGASVVYTVDTGSTVATAPTPTASVFTVASIGSIIANKVVEVDLGTGGTADLHYRRVASISGAAITLAEALPEAPAAVDTVKMVTKALTKGAAHTSAATISLKLEYTHPKTSDVITTYVYKAKSGGTTLEYNTNKNVLTCTFKALSVPAVDSGNTWHRENNF